jgi:integrase
VRRLKELRAALIAMPNKRGKHLSRNTINGHVRRIKQVFRWGVENEKVRPETLTALEAVSSLRKNRSEAKETKPVDPVPLKDIEAIRPHVSRQVWAMVQLQLLTAARPGEIVGLRPCDIEMEGAVWVASLGGHKTAHRGKDRELYFGPKAQAVLRPFLLRDAGAFLFSALEAERERYTRMSESGKKQPRRENQKPNPRETDRRIGECYTVGSYYAAIQRGCEAAGVTPWSPHRLRHTAATDIRRQFGIEAAQVILGHSEISTTQIYAEKNRAAALDIAKRIG